MTTYARRHAQQKAEAREQTVDVLITVGSAALGAAIVMAPWIYTAITGLRAF